MASQAALQLVISLKDQVSGPIKNITGGLTTLGKVSAGLAAGGLLGIGAGLVKAASAGLGFNNAMEQATARINAFTGDAGETAEILEMVRARAAKTPFAFEEMAAAAASLGPVSRTSGVALEELIAQAEILAASNPAQGFEGAVLALKEATGGDWTSIIERFDLPRQRLKELAADGVPAIDAIKIAMGEMGLNADLVSNMANTAAGRWSTLVDTFTTLASTITAPIFEGVSKGMGELQVKLDENMPRLQAFATMLGEKVGGVVSWLTTTGIPVFVDVLSTIGSTINDYVITPVKDVVAAFLEWQNFGTEWGIVAALQAIGENFPLLQPLTDWLSTVAPPLVQGLREGFGLVRDAFITFTEALAGEWHADPEKIHPLHLAVGDFGTMIHDEVLPRLRDFFNYIKENVGPSWLVFTTSIREDVMPALELLALILSKQRDEDLPATESKWVWFGERFGQIINSAMELASGWGADIRAITLATIADIEFMVADWERTLERWEAAIETAVGDVVAWFTGLPGRITTAVAGFSTLLLQAGKDLINGLIDGIKSIDVGTVLGNVVSAGIAAAKAVVGIKSPSTKTRDEIGVPLVQGVIVGIEKEAPNLRAAAAALGEKIPAWMTEGVEKAAPALIEAIKQPPMDAVKDLYRDIKQPAQGAGIGIAEGIAEGYTGATGLLNQTLIDTLTGSIHGASDAALAALNQLINDWNAAMGRIKQPGGGLAPDSGGPITRFRAMGGPVSAGTPYIVGERGPERFVPRQSGTIVPNDQMGGSINITINASGGSVREIQAIVERALDAKGYSADRRTRMA